MKDDNILYDLLVHSEWSKNIDVQQKPSSFTATATTKINSLRAKLQSVFTSTLTGLPTSVYRLKFELKLPWKIAVGHTDRSNLSIVAIALDDVIEIKSSKDDYNNTLSKCTISLDPNPSWRYMEWSPDCSMLAFAYSYGFIEVFDILGSKLFSMNPASNFRSNDMNTFSDFSCAVARIIFIETNEPDIESSPSVFSSSNAEAVYWNYKMLVFNHKGQLSCYTVSSALGEYKDTFTFNFSSQSSFGSSFTGAISDVAYHPEHPLILFISSAPKSSEEHLPENFHYGLTAWRLLSDYPYLKLVTLNVNEDLCIAQNGLFILQWWNNLIKIGTKSYKQDWILRLSISPDSKYIGAAHESGAISIWNVPSLRLQSFWSVEDQSLDQIFESFTEKRKKRFGLIENELIKISDLHWWNNRSIVISRISGAVTISSLDPDYPLINLLGDCPEYFESPPPPEIYNPFKERFMALECEIKIKNKNKRNMDDERINDEESSEEDDEEELEGITETFSKMMKSTLYYLTDSERFLPTKKMAKIKLENYKLIEFKVTTPEELFDRKLNNEEYGEALDIAKLYNLDADIVYQRQWQNTKVSKASIQDYLSKISKKSWVIQECIERIPLDLDSAKALFEFGLKITDIDYLIGQPNILDSDLDVEDSYHVSKDEYIKMLKRKLEERRQKMISSFDFENLSLDQKQLILWRLKLFNYLDRLNTYEEILGGRYVAAEKYDDKFFQKFRNFSSFEAAINFAHDCNCEAVSCMLTYHGDDTLKHRLAILCNFPETYPPKNYQRILPECPLKDETSDEWESLKFRQEDWSEKYCNFLISKNNELEFEEDYYTKNPGHKNYITSKLTTNLISKWYNERAQEIEKFSSLSDLSLQLVELGIEKNVPNLNKLKTDLEIYQTIIYECIPRFPAYDLSFSEYLTLTNEERINILMMGATENESNFVYNIQKFLIPFLEKCDPYHEEVVSKQRLFQNYLIYIARNNLSLCRQVFVNSKAVRNDDELAEAKIIQNVDDLLQLALDCIYACKQENQLDDAFGIVECLPIRTKGLSKELEALHDKIDFLEKHLQAAEILQQHSCPVLISYLKNLKDNCDTEGAILLIKKVTRHGTKSEPPLTENDWHEMLNNLIELRSHCLEECISTDKINEIFVETLLSSGRKENFGLASSLMELVPAANIKRKKRLIPLEKSAEIIVAVAKEYVNSSSSIADPYIELAKECIHLIDPDFRSKEPLISEEVDFIDALSILHQDFNFKLLPIQIRLVEPPKLDVIQQVLLNNQKSYKKTGKLLQLASLLHVYGPENVIERESKVMSMIVKAALSVRDYKHAWSVCKCIISQEYYTAWEVCRDLGLCEDFNNLEAKLELLSFALTHSESETGDEIEKLIEMLKNIKLQLITDNGSSRASGLLTGSHQQFTKTAQQLATWVSNLKKQHNIENEESDVEYPIDISVPTFYDGTITNFGTFSVLSNKLDIDYYHYGLPKVNDENNSVLMAQFLLRSEILRGSSKEKLIPLLKKLSNLIIFKDTPLGLSYLLSIHDSPEIESVFDEFEEKTPTLLYIALYCYSILCYQTNNIDISFEKTPCEEIILNAVELAKNDDKCSSVSLLLLKYHKLYHECLQAQTLRSLHPHVDVIRFANDDVYKEETILGLAMTDDAELFNSVLKLAEKYGVEEFKVNLVYLENLMTSGGPASHIEEQILSNSEFVDIMKQNFKAVINAFEKRVFPLIDGNDHDKLILYYKLLNTFSGTSNWNNHIKNLKKLKKLINENKFDYKCLFDSSNNLEEILSSLLNSNNIHGFARWISALNTDETKLSPSFVYSIWIKKHFFDDIKSIRNSTDWLHRYESYGDMIKKLNPQDFLLVIDEITFSIEAITILDEISVRIDLTRRALKQARQHLGNTKDLQKKETWTNISEEIKNNLDHLVKLDEDELIKSLLDELQNRNKNYVIDFIRSKSKEENLKNMIFKAMEEEKSIDFIRTLLALCPETFNWDLETVFIDAMNSVMLQLKSQLIEDAKVDIAFKEPLKLLNYLLINACIPDYRVLSDEQIINIMQSFCLDNSLNGNIRIKVAELMQKFVDNEKLMPEMNKYVMKLNLKTKILKNWDLEVSAENEINFDELFEKLLNKSDSLQKLSSLSEILKIFDNQNSSQWKTLLFAMYQCEDESVEILKNIVICIEDLNESVKSNFELDLFNKIKSSIDKNNLTSIKYLLKYCLLSNDIHLHEEAVKICALINNNILDKDLSNMFVDKQINLLPKFVTTIFYEEIVDIIIERKDEELLSKVIHLLVDRDLNSYAGLILMKYNKTHDSLINWKSAENYVKKWIKKFKI